MVKRAFRTSFSYKKKRIQTERSSEKDEKRRRKVMKSVRFDRKHRSTNLIRPIRARGPRHEETQGETMRRNETNEVQERSEK